MRVIRQILLTEYIGAILVAVLVADALTALINAAVAQISYYLRFGHSIVPDAHQLSTTHLLLESLSRMALFLISAYVIARWLYVSKPDQPNAATNG